jgi:hypothetical protein
MMFSNMGGGAISGRHQIIVAVCYTSLTCTQVPQPMLASQQPLDEVQCSATAATKVNVSMLWWMVGRIKHVYGMLCRCIAYVV